MVSPWNSKRVESIGRRAEGFRHSSSPSNEVAMSLLLMGHRMCGSAPRTSRGLYIILVQFSLNLSSVTLYLRCLVLGLFSCEVRYDANSQFNEHGHPDGEEILVLEGSWQGDLLCALSPVCLACSPVDIGSTVETNMPHDTTCFLFFSLYHILAGRSPWLILLSLSSVL